MSGMREIMYREAFLTMSRMREIMYREAFLSI